MDQYFGLTHPSEPNYLSTVGGDFFGLGDDNFYNIPAKYGLLLKPCRMTFHRFF
jgi:hypothetical protein